MTGMVEEDLHRTILLAPPSITVGILCTFLLGRLSFQKPRLALVQFTTYLSKLNSLLPMDRRPGCICHACGVKKLLGSLVINAFFLVQLRPDWLHPRIRD